MQLKNTTSQAVDALRQLLVRRVEHDERTVKGRINVRPSPGLVVDKHHDRPIHGLRAGVREGHLLVDELSTAQREQARRRTHAQEVHCNLRGGADLLRGRLQIGVLQQGTHVVPGRAVLRLDGQAVTEAIVLHRPVNRVEVITGVEGITIQGLRAQRLCARRPERGRLSQCHGGLADQRHAHAVLHRSIRRHLVGDQVEERLVVVGVHVVDVLGGLGGEPGALTVVVQLRARHGLAVVGGERVVLQVARQAQLHQVHAVQIIGAAISLGASVKAVEVRERSRAEALQHTVVVVEGAATVHGIAQAVVERADAGAVQLALRGLGEQRVVRDLTEVPALAVDVQARAVHAVLLEGELREGLLGALHLISRVVPHQVEAEAVDVVVLRPVDHRVDHEAFAHRVLGGHVRAARRGLHASRGVEALVVAGHDAVEDRVGVLAGGRRVVVDLVEHDLHADVVQAADHGAEFAHTGATVLVGGGRVGAFGGHPVQRVVAPVVGVLVGDGGHGRLLFLGGRACILGDLRNLLLGALLRDGRNVEGGQQVHRVHAGLGQLGKVTHTVGLVLREGHVGAAHVFGHGLVGRREVAHVQLVDGALRVVLDDGCLDARPPVGGDRGVVHVDSHGTRGVGGQTHRVGVGHLVGLDGARGGHVDAHLPQVLGTLLDGTVGVVDAPAPIIGARGGGAHGVALHLGVSAARSTRVPRQQRDVLSGGCPQREGRSARVIPTHPVRGLGGLGGVDGVERGGDLHAREGVDGLAGLLGDRDLAGEGLAGPGLVEGGLQGDVAVEVGVCHRHLGGQVARDGQRRDGRSGDSTVRQGRATLGGGDQLVGEGRGAIEDLGPGDALREQGGRPCQGCGIDPVSALLTDADNGSVSGGDVQLVGRGIIGE